MSSGDFPYHLYLVTDEAACLGRDFFWVLEEALKGGADIVQLREKEYTTAAFIDKARKCQEICERYGVPLVINDNLDVALAVKADALHVGQQDLSAHEAKRILGEDYPVGLSLDHRGNLDDPDSDLAWYFGVSPIFSTPTKTDTYDAWGLEGLAWLRGKTAKPLVAIGGIKIENATEIIEKGADCLAVVSGICSAENPGKAAEAYLEAIKRAKRK